MTILSSRKTTITLVFEGTDAADVADITTACDFGQLLRDALGEFIQVRTPAREYVTKRYLGIDRARIVYKTREVEKRCLLAGLLKKAYVTIETDET